MNGPTPHQVGRTLCFAHFWQHTVCESYVMLLIGLWTHRRSAVENVQNEWLYRAGRPIIR